MSDTPDTPTPKTPKDLRTAFKRIKKYATEAPWLRKPVYHRFTEAMQPTADFSMLDPYQQGLWNYAFKMIPLEGDLEPVELALSYWNSDLIRTNLNALFFGGATVESAAKATRLEKLSIDAFKRLFCEVGVFRDSPLLLLEYIQRMPELSKSDKEEKNLYRMAVEYGSEWVVWKLSRGMEGHKPGIKIVDAMTNLAFWRAMEASVAPANTAGAREGRQYIKLAADLALSKHNAKMGEMNSIKDLAMKLLAEQPEDYDANNYDEPAPEISDLLYEDPDRED